LKLQKSCYTTEVDYSSRTRANVEAADLTLIFSHGPLTGGSLLTQQFAEELGKLSAVTQSVPPLVT
jgi:hypothetical protein